MGSEASSTAALAPPKIREQQLVKDDLLDPATRGGCHAQAFAEWQRSPHAQSADDPVFVAMNQMGQGETHGALGNLHPVPWANGGVRGSDLRWPEFGRGGQTSQGRHLLLLPRSRPVDTSVERRTRC